MPRWWHSRNAGTNYRGSLINAKIFVSAAHDFERKGTLVRPDRSITGITLHLATLQRTSGAYLYQYHRSRRRGYRFEMISDNVKGVRRHVRDGSVTEARLLYRPLTLTAAANV